MLHVEQHLPTSGENTDVANVTERRESLKAFGNWGECQCKSECGVMWNFSNHTGLYRDGDQRSCVLVKCVKANWKLGLFRSGRKEHAAWKKTEESWLASRM